MILDALPMHFDPTLLLVVGAFLFAAATLCAVYLWPEDPR